MLESADTDDITALVSKYLFPRHRQGSSHAHDVGPSTIGSSDFDNLALLVEARLHFKSTALRTTMARWRQRAEARQRRKRHDETVAAAYYGSRLSLVYFRAWQWSLQHRRDEASAGAAAASHARLLCMARPFARWRARSAQTHAALRGCRAIVAVAEYTLLRRAFTALLFRWHRRQLAAQLLSINAQRLRRPYFRSWVQAAAVRARQRAAVEACCGLRRVAALHHAFARWHCRSVRQHIGRRQRLLQAVDMHCDRARAAHCRRVWRLWTRFARGRRVRRQVAVAASAADCAAQRPFFERWARWVQRLRVADRCVQERVDRQRVSILRHWRAAVGASAVARRRWQAAEAFHKALLHERRMRRPFAAWRQLAGSTRFHNAQVAAALALRQRLLRAWALRAVTAVAEQRAIDEGPSTMLALVPPRPTPIRSEWDVLAGALAQQRPPVTLSPAPLAPASHGHGPQPVAATATVHQKLARYNMLRLREPQWREALSARLSELQYLRASAPVGCVVARAQLHALQSDVDSIRRHQAELVALRADIAAERVAIEQALKNS